MKTFSQFLLHTRNLKIIFLRLWTHGREAHKTSCTLLLNPSFVEIQEDSICRLICVCNISHKSWMYGIALVATHRIIEIYHIKLYLFGVFFQILLKMIIHDGGQWNLR